ncbi:MAG: hypothetical protein L3J39_06175 [Verrucomicrobiales bacterium]|nr:hypothetical protein [Verrucomicrobiales bacterium]
MPTNPSENQQDPVQSFTRAVRSRLNRFRFLDLFLRAFAIGTTVLLLVGLYYILRGHAVPKFYYGLALGLIITASLLWFAARRWTRDQAAHFADRFFGLKDSISSYLHFKEQNKSGEFYQLQAEASIDSVTQLKPESISYHWSRRLLSLCAVLLLAAGLTAFKKPSSEVLEQIRIATETTAKTEEINQHLEELIDELEKTLDEDEKGELKPDQLRQLVKEMEKTSDRKEAMKQYAELERQLRKAARKLEQRKNEQLMAKAGEELQKDQESKKLGKKLSEKKFREAAKDLEKLAEAANQPQRKLSEQRKQLARVKAAAQRMAAAAKAANRKGSTSSKSKSGAKSTSSAAANQSKSSGNGKGESGTGSGSSGSSGESMEELLAQLDQSAKALDKNLKNAQQEIKLNGKLSKKSLGQCNSSRSSLLSKFDKLNASLCKMGSKRDAKLKLLSMCKKIGQCQGYLNKPGAQSLAQCLKPGSKPGGKKAGVGSVESRRDGMGEAFDQGELTQLSGTKGSGPSQSTVESADDGSGVSSRRTTAKRREFKKQLESFVQREDVPDDVKEGVKQYFMQIHQADEK